MNKGKRNIQQHADKEVKHLMTLLDKSQVSEFKKMVPELQGGLDSLYNKDTGGSSADKNYKWFIALEGFFPCTEKQAFDKFITAPDSYFFFSLSRKI